MAGLMTTQSMQLRQNFAGISLTSPQQLHSQPKLALRSTTRMAQSLQVLASLQTLDPNVLFCTTYLCTSTCRSSLQSERMYSISVRSLCVEQGKVVSTSSTKTAVVAVESFVPHRLYGKRMRQTKKYQAHDEDSKCTIGDLITIKPCRPLSKSKRFTVGEILRKSDL